MLYTLTNFYPDLDVPGPASEAFRFKGAALRGNMRSGVPFDEVVEGMRLLRPGVTPALTLYAQDEDRVTVRIEAHEDLAALDKDLPTSLDKS